MKRLIEFINRFQVVPVVSRVVFPLITISLGLMVVPDIEQLSNNYLSVQRLFYTFVGLTTFFVVVAVIEFIWITLSPKYDSIKRILGWVLDKIQLISRGVFKIFYIYPLSFLLKPIVVYIIDAKDKKEVRGESFLFVNQGIGRNDDDHYFPRVISTKNLIIYIQPSAGTPRWRFGVKFSNRKDEFPDYRYDETHILFHLTKEEGDDSLRYNLYSSGKNDNAKIIDRYKDTRCSIRIETNSSQTKVFVYDESDRKILEKILPAKEYCQILAWADGRSAFKIAGIIVEK